MRNPLAPLSLWERGLGGEVGELRHHSPHAASCAACAEIADCAILPGGRVSEWFKVPLSKSGEPQKGSVGSNPTPSAVRVSRLSLLWRSPIEA